MPLLITIDFYSPFSANRYINWMKGWHLRDSYNAELCYIRLIQCWIHAKQHCCDSILDHCEKLLNCQWQYMYMNFSGINSLIYFPFSCQWICTRDCPESQLPLNVWFDIGTSWKIRLVREQIHSYHVHWLSGKFNMAWLDAKFKYIPGKKSSDILAIAW